MDRHQGVWERGQRSKAARNNIRDGPQEERSKLIRAKTERKTHFIALIRDNIDLNLN